MSEENKALPYCNRITLESTGPEGQLYKRTIDEQYFDENDAQVAHMVTVFPAVVNAVERKSIEFGAQDMERRKAKKNAG